MFTNLSFSDLNFQKNDLYVPLSPKSVFDTTSAVHFHNFSTHTTHGT